MPKTIEYLARIDLLEKKLSEAEAREKVLVEALSHYAEDGLSRECPECGISCAEAIAALADKGEK